MKKLTWAISFLSLIGTMIVLRFMPESVPMHYDAAGNIDRWGSKYENLIFPVIILAMSLFWTLIVGYYEKKALKTRDEKESAGAKSNAKVVCVLGLGMAVMFTLMQGFILYGAYSEAQSGATHWTVDIGRVSLVLMGIIYILIGNYMTKTRTNSTVGFRVSWSMYNDNTWRKSNRFAAYAIMLVGVVTILMALILKSSFGAAMASTGTLIVATVVALVYAHKVYVQEKASEKGGER
jgi:uncharacterized membrane protein